MKPSELSSTLRHIAAAIDKSKSPKRELVARDLKQVLAAIEDTSDQEVSTEEAPTE